MDKNIIIEKKAFSKHDIDLLNYDILPKKKKAILNNSFYLLLFIPFAPFLPAPITSKAMIQPLSYEKALLITVIVILFLIFGIYYTGIILLEKDINEGYKYIYKTRILEKSWRGDNKFEIKISERPKKVIMKFLLDKDDCINWTENDILEIEFLKRSGDVLSFKNLNIK